MSHYAQQLRLVSAEISNTQAEIDELNERIELSHLRVANMFRILHAPKRENDDGN
jgi:hypothetical protein